MTHDAIDRLEKTIVWRRTERIDDVEWMAADCGPEVSLLSSFFHPQEGKRKGMAEEDRARRARICAWGSRMLVNLSFISSPIAISPLSNVDDLYMQYVPLSPSCVAEED